MSDVQHIDAAMIEQLRELLGERFGELVERFVSDGNRRLQLLQSAVADLNFEVIHAEAHGLKGSSRNLGAGPLGDYCQQLENDGKNKNSPSLEQTLAAVEQEFAAVVAQLKSS